jgi:hypothetical protein
MEVSLGPNEGCSAKGKKNIILHHPVAYHSKLKPLIKLQKKKNTNLERQVRK